MATRHRWCSRSSPTPNVRKSFRGFHGIAIAALPFSALDEAAIPKVSSGATVGGYL